MQFGSIDESKSLFHYTTRDAALGSILPSRRFRFSSFDAMRDPFENQDWALPGGGAIRDADSDKADRRYFEFLHIANAVKRRARLAAFSAAGESDGFFNNHGWSRASMWQHYGEAHRGVCLVFDRELLISAASDSLRAAGLPSPYFKPVKYELDFRYDPTIELSEEVVSLDGSALKEFVFRFVEDHHEDLFYRKSRDWSNEMEYRFVVTAPDYFDQPVEVNIEKALTGIIVGARFPDWAVSGALEIANHMNVLAKKVTWLSHEPFLTKLKPSANWVG